MRYILLSILSISLLFTSCTKDNGPLIMTPLEKMQGEWFYSKACFINNHGFNRDNVIADFVDCRVIVSGNFITMENLRTGQVLEGDFEFYSASTGGYWDDDGSYIEDIERFINVVVTDTYTSEQFVYDWQVNLLTRNKLHFGEYYSDGNYAFKMRKL